MVFGGGGGASLGAFPFLLVCCLFLFLLTSFTVQYDAGPVPGIVLVSLQSIIQIIYLNDRGKWTWQKLIQTTLQRNSSIERWRGKIEGRTDKWKEGRRTDKWRETERGGLGLACRQACSVRAIEDKVVQGLLSCLMSYSGGVLMGWGALRVGLRGSLWSACVSCSCVGMWCLLPVTHQNAVCVCLCVSSANGLVL